jgi:hypothetical protein
MYRRSRYHGASGICNQLGTSVGSSLDTRFEADVWSGGSHVRLSPLTVRPVLTPDSVSIELNLLDTHLIGVRSNVRKKRQQNHNTPKLHVS